MHPGEHPSNPDASAHAAKDRKPFFAMVFVMLLVLTAMSFWVANSYLMENRTTGWAAMMAISTAKALLVILFFMHLWWEKSWKYVLTVPVTIIGVVLVLLLIPDVGNRFATYSKTRRAAAPEPADSGAGPMLGGARYDSGLFDSGLSPPTATK